MARVPFTLVGASGGDGARWQPNFIDYRSSVANVDRRRDQGETVETCAGCGCEADLDPVPHYPGGTTSRACPTLAVGVSSSAVDGRALLDRMDAGEPLREVESEIDVAALLADVDEVLARDDEPDEIEEMPDAEPEPKERVRRSSPASDRWTQAAIIQTIQAIAVETGFVPAQRAFIGPSTEERPNLALIKRVFGSFGDAIEAAGYPRPRRGVAPLALADLEESGREPMAVAEPVAVSASPVLAGEEPSRPENEQARRRAWDKADIIAAIQRWNLEYGYPPTSTEWARRVDGYPTTSTVAARFGSWANAIEDAGFPRPTRGGVPLKPAAAPAKRVRVRGTGLTYATPEEAYMAADEIENDGRRVAEQARFDGNEAKAEQAIDQSRELAEKLRDAAHAFESRARENGASNIHENIHAAPLEKGVEVSLPLAYARALIAGMRAAADALEQELEQ